MFAEVANYANDAGMYIFLYLIHLPFFFLCAKARGIALPSEVLVYEIFVSSSVPSWKQKSKRWKRLGTEISFGIRSRIDRDIEAMKMSSLIKSPHPRPPTAVQEKD